MASVGHVIVGLAIATIHDRDRPVSLRVPLLFGALSLLPDLDVVGFPLGVRYADPFGHRGASHSLVIAFALALALAKPVATWLDLPARRTAIALGLVLASHGVLDAFTDGGLGIALLWPFSDARFFAPIQPIPVAPIGLGFVSTRGLYCALVELTMFLPLLLAALLAPRVSSVVGSRS